MTVTYNEKVIIAAAESPVLDVHNKTNAASNQVVIVRGNDRTGAAGDEGYVSFMAPWERRSIPSIFFSKAKATAGKLSEKKLTQRI